MVSLAFYVVELPCEFEFTISHGTQSTAKQIFVELTYFHQGQTFVGMGSGVPSPFYGESFEHTLDFYQWIQDENLLEPISPFDIQRFHQVFQKFPGYMAVKASLDMALYDLQGKVLGQPVWKLWGLDKDKVPRSSYTLGLADMDTMTQKAHAAVERGYDIIKMKVGGEHDLEALQLVRSLAPEVTIRVDANTAWTLEDALTMLPKLRDLGVEFVEEPLRLDTSPEDRLRLKEAACLPIMADETVHTLNDIQVVAPWVHAINLKHTKTGGLTEAKRMIHAARAHHLNIMLGGFVESTLSVSAFAQLAPLVDYLDLDGALLLAEDCMEGIGWDKNQPLLSDRPGIGVIKKEGVSFS